MKAPHEKGVANHSASETPCTSGNSMHENRETSRSAMRERMRTSSPAGEGQGRTTRAYDLEGSDSVVVTMMSPNKVRDPMKGSAAEAMEGRAGAKENCECAWTCRTQSRVSRFNCHEQCVGRQPRRHAPTSEAGAVCGNSARTDLCGGCRVTGIPTATA